MNERDCIVAGDQLAQPTSPTMAVVGDKAIIRLNRPRYHNRFEPVDLAVMAEHFDTIEQDLGIRVLVLTATGPTFSSGYDIGSLASGSDAPTEGRNHAFGALCDRLEALRVPTICAFNGSVYGGATDFALACDFRIGVEGMRMFMPASRLGIHYYYSGLRRFVERIGIAASKRLFLTSDEIGSDVMLHIGFVDEIVPADALQTRTDELASVLAQRAPLAVQGMKASLNAIANGQADPFAIQAKFFQSLHTNDLAEGLKSWSEKRTPIFRGS